LLRLSAQIVSAHVTKNAVSPDALPALIRSVYEALAAVDQPAASAPELPHPAVPIKRSVFPDYIVCLEDGAKMKMLKRYLKVRFNLTPEQYRERWGLPRDYPMVAPNYAERRSSLAKQFGLGRKAEPEPEPEPEPVAPPKKRGRAAKA
jgi:predicted transcriptional regulator